MPYPESLEFDQAGNLQGYGNSLEASGAVDGGYGPSSLMLDYDNVIGQVWKLRALDRVDEAEAILQSRGLRSDNDVDGK